MWYKEILSWNYFFTSCLWYFTCETFILRILEAFLSILFLPNDSTLGSHRQLLLCNGPSGTLAAITAFLNFSCTFSTLRNPESANFSIFLEFWNKKPCFILCYEKMEKKFETLAAFFSFELEFFECRFGFYLKRLSRSSDVFLIISVLKSYFWLSSISLNGRVSLCIFWFHHDLKRLMKMTVSMFGVMRTTTILVIPVATTMTRKKMTISTLSTTHSSPAANQRHLEKLTTNKKEAFTVGKSWFSTLKFYSFKRFMGPLRSKK